MRIVDLINQIGQTRNEKYIFRMNFTNNGKYPILIEKATHLLGIATKSGGGGNPPSPFFILDDSTPTVENGGSYTDLSKTLTNNPDVTTVMYFGSKSAAGSALQTTDNNGVSVSVFVVLFGYEDRDGGDTDYGQTLPFQAYRLHD